MERNRDKELVALLALIGEDDIHRISTAWDRLSHRDLRGMLSATDTRAAGKWWWNPDRAQFARGAAGYIPPAAIRQALLTFNQRQGDKLAALTLSLKDGSIKLENWQAGMRQGIKIAQLVNLTVGRGGLQAITAEDLAKVEETVVYQFGRLERFTRQLEAAPEIKQGAAHRAKAYALSAIPTFEQGRRGAAEVAQFTLERNRMAPAEHCYRRSDDVLPDCPGLTDLGWVGIGELPAPGLRLCRWNCKCHIEYRKGAA